MSARTDGSAIYGAGCVNDTGSPLLVRRVLGRAVSLRVGVAGVRWAQGRVAGAEYLAEPVTEKRADDRGDGQQHDDTGHGDAARSQSRTVTIGHQRPSVI